MEDLPVSLQKLLKRCVRFDPAVANEAKRDFLRSLAQKKHEKKVLDTIQRKGRNIELPLMIECKERTVSAPLTREILDTGIRIAEEELREAMKTRRDELEKEEADLKARAEQTARGAEGAGGGAKRIVIHKKGQPLALQQWHDRAAKSKKTTRRKGRAKKKVDLKTHLHKMIKAAVSSLRTTRIKTLRCVDDFPVGTRAMGKVLDKMDPKLSLEEKIMSIVRDLVPVAPRNVHTKMLIINYKKAHIDINQDKKAKFIHMGARFIEDTAHHVFAYMEAHRIRSQRIVVESTATKRVGGKEIVETKSQVCFVRLKPNKSSLYGTRPSLSTSWSGIVDNIFSEEAMFQRDMEERETAEEAVVESIVTRMEALTSELESKFEGTEKEFEETKKRALREAFGEFEEDVDEWEETRVVKIPDFPVPMKLTLDMAKKPKEDDKKAAEKKAKETETQAARPRRVSLKPVLSMYGKK
jgi:hypothetical protein